MSPRSHYRSPEPSDSESDSLSILSGRHGANSPYSFTDPESDAESECALYMIDERQQSIDTRNSMLRMLRCMSPSLISKPSRGRSRSSRIQLPLQASYTGPAPVICLQLASNWCENLGAEGMLVNFNRLLGTRYSLTTPGLRRHLMFCIEDKYDFGQAYARLRPHWHSREFPKLSKKLQELESEDGTMRHDAVDNEINRVRSDVPPRRLWDLYSNRVVPWWLVRPAKETIYVVSHSWVHEEDRVYRKSRVNGGEWRVPLPMDIDEDLEPVRNELLNYGAEYAWLDVLCLRQRDSLAGKRMERLRKEEHRIDVPTIGYVYEGQQTIVTYYSGLGLPFRATSLDDERHWLNRAWTLQETHHNPLIGGLPAIQHLQDFRQRLGVITDDDDEEKRFFHALAREITFVGSDFDVFAVLHRMRMRGADNKLDKVCGIAYLLTTKSTLPTYDIDESPENAWTRLVRSMDYRYRAELFFLYPSRGADTAWMPSWAQTQGDDDLPYPGRTEIIPPAKEKEYVMFKPERPGYRFAGLRIQDCKVKGLERSAKRCRDGTLVISMKGSRVKRIKVRAHHQEPIAETKDFRYDLLGTHDLRYWVVGETRRGIFRKVSVLRIENEEALRIVEELGLAEKVSSVPLE